MSVSIKRFSWWAAVLFAVTLPITFNWMFENLGGYVVEWMYYSNYRDLLSLVFLLTAFLIGWLMTKPSRYLGMRFTFAFVSILACVLAALGPRPMCEEKKFFSVLGAERPKQVVDYSSCEG